MGDPVYNHLKSVAKARDLNEIDFMAAMQDYMRAVRVHESDNIYTRIQEVETSPGVLEEVGVARGAYQYEMDAGRKKDAPGMTYGAATALRSTKNLFKELGDVPNWINTLIVRYQKEGDIDFSEIESQMTDTTLKDNSPISNYGLLIDDYKISYDENMETSKKGTELKQNKPSMRAKIGKDKKGQAY